MENVVFKYSDFFEDDGGFDKIRKDFDDLGDDLIRKAKDIKGKVKLFDLDDVDNIKEFEDQTEDLTKAFKKYGEAKEKINDIEEEYLKAIKKSSEVNEDQIDRLVKLDKQLEEYRKQLKEINTFAKLGLKTDRDLNKERVEATLNIKKVQKEINKYQKEILETNKLTTKENKLLQAKITLEKNQIKTLEDVRERMKALRIVVQSLDLETQSEQIAEFNAEINELTEVLSDNSDKFIQSKINIGNYEESIVNALKNTDAFATGISGLDSALSSVLSLFFLTRDELDALEASMDKNTSAVKRFAVAFGRLNKVLKASIIGVVILAIAALGSAFGNTRAGAVRLEKVMTTLSSAFSTFGQVSKIIFEEVGDAIQSIYDFIRNPFAKQAEKTAKDTQSAWERIQEAVRNGQKAIVLGLENVDRAFNLEDKVKRLTQEITRLNGELQVTQSIADDSTISLREQLEANERALVLTEEIGKKRIDQANLELEAINERVKQNILANSVEADNIDLSKTGIDFAKATLDLAEQRGVALEISNDLIDEQQNAVLGVLEAQNELNLAEEENRKKRREINRDLFEQNLDLLIDLIDTEKNISEQFVNDITKNFQKRIDEFNRFLVRFRENAQRELDEFSKEANNLGLDLDFSIEYDENGDFKVFVNDSELATDNIVELNQQLQDLGLNEIDINRFREFIVEARNGVRDFRDLSKSIVQVGIDVKELRRNISISREELNNINQLQLQIDKLSSTIREGVKPEDQKKILKQIEELERQKQAITDNADQARIRSRIKAIDDELQTVEVGSQRYLELIQERTELEIQLATQGTDKSLQRLKDTNKKLAEEQEKFAEETRRIINAVLDAAVQAERKRVEATEKRIDRQNELIDEQRRRAEAGLTNTLAFEQRELGKREAERIKAEKRAERLEKIKALYSSYNNYASRGDENPILKALRDFAILEAITASFGEGGVVEDRLPSDGIFRGRSHQGKHGGIPILVEGREGIFSTKEMDNLGKDNFYKIKHMAGMGKIGSNFFTQQGHDFIKAVPIMSTDPRLVKEMQDVKRAIEKKPVPKWDMAGITNGVMELVETTLTKNKTVRNHYKTKRPRI